MDEQTLQILQQNTWFFIILMLWVLPWKAVALWKSARSNQKIWFVILLLINTLGILEILYIFIFSRINKKLVQEKLAINN
ncbi:MAG: DUF5652 family protein [Patescibacteria group bacterium]|nr:DUF5652 family protein [Patescibacteria group bacterium]